MISSFPWHDPISSFNKIHSPSCIFLDSQGDPKNSRQRWSLLCPAPKPIIDCDHLTFRNNKSTRDCYQFQRLRHYLAMIKKNHAPLNKTLPDGTKLPFSGGVIGILSYQAGLNLMSLSSRHEADNLWPDILCFECTSFFLFDRLKKKIWWVSLTNETPPDIRPTPSSPEASPKLLWKAEQTIQQWVKNVEKIRHYIESGDIFQANYTMRWHATAEASINIFNFYQKIRQQAPAPFGAFIKHNNKALLSASVERFISLSSKEIIETRPIKGTAPIGKTEEEKKYYYNHLAMDEKERAENLMITDLMRHDIGQLCELGSISVPQLCKVEPFAKVHHLVSSIMGKIKKEHDAFSILEKTFPPGSVTGAPKKRALEIIDETEISSRGAYCGSLFHIGLDGAMDSSVLIRTIEVINNSFKLGAGGGITWPSDPYKEYHEACLKAAPFLI